MDEPRDQLDEARLAAESRLAFAFLADLGYREVATDISDLGVTVRWLGTDRGVEFGWERRDRYIDIRVVLLRDGQFPVQLPIIFLPLTFLLTEADERLSLTWPANEADRARPGVVLGPLAEALQRLAREPLAGGFGAFERFARSQPGGSTGFDWWASLPSWTPEAPERTVIDDIDGFSKDYYEHFRIAHGDRRLDDGPRDESIDCINELQAQLDDLSSSDANAGWRAHVGLVERAPSPGALEFVAAGPLEDFLLVQWNRASLDSIVADLRSSPRLREALDLTWGWTEVPNHVFDRLSEFMSHHAQAQWAKARAETSEHAPRSRHARDIDAR